MNKWGDECVHVYRIMHLDLCECVGGSVLMCKELWMKSFKCVDTNYRVWIIFKSQWRKNWFNIKTAEFLNMLNCSVVQACQYTALTIQAWIGVPDLLLCAPTGVRAVRYIRLFLPSWLCCRGRKLDSSWVEEGWAIRPGRVVATPLTSPPHPQNRGRCWKGRKRGGGR